LIQELEDAQDQLKIVGEEREMNPKQVDWVLALAGISDGSSGAWYAKDSEILRFCGADWRELQGCIAQLAMNIGDEHWTTFDKLSKMIYAANRLERVAWIKLNHILTEPGMRGENYWRNLWTNFSWLLVMKIYELHQIDNSSNWDKMTDN
jgi:hypothetical protein